MGKYIKDISYIVTDIDAMAMVEKADNPRDRALVALLFLTGGRPSELLELEDKNISEVVDGYIGVKLVTKKRRKRSGDAVTGGKRILELPMASPFTRHILVWKGLKQGRLFQFSDVRLWQIVDKLSEHKFCPYSFRHSRLTKLARGGATISDLLNFKGGSSIRGIEPYLRGKPIGRRLKLDD